MKNANYCLIFSFIIFGYVNPIAGWRPFRIEKYDVTANSFSEKIDINATITGYDGLSIYLNIKKNVQHPFAKVELYFDAGDGLFDLKLMNTTIDICRFFRDKKYLPILQLIYKTLQQRKFPTSCPLKKKLYVGENLIFDVEKLPPTMPNKQMSLAVTLMSMEGSHMTPLIYYKIFIKIVNIAVKH